MIRDFYLEHKECLHFNKKKSTPNLKMGKGTEQTILRRVDRESQAVPKTSQEGNPNQTTVERLTALRSCMAKVFVNVLWVWVLFLRAWCWEEEGEWTFTELVTEHIFVPSKMRKAHCSLQPIISFQRLKVDIKNTALSLQKPGFGSGLGYYSYLKRGANFKGCSEEGMWGTDGASPTAPPETGDSAILTLPPREVGGLHSQTPAESLGETPREQGACFALHRFFSQYFSFSCKMIPWF